MLGWWWLVVAAVSAGVCMRALVGLGGHSGRGKPPMFGDFEAQRHWMEVTYHTPVKEWYFNTTDNNLEYWGLDYPPLTAFHSWLCGWLAHNVFDPSWVELHSSRGAETPQVRMFMRAMALVADALVFLPAAVAWASLLHCDRTRSNRTATTSTVSSRTFAEAAAVLNAVVFQPVFVLVDHGHFQFNAISLGLALWAVVCLKTGRHLLGSALFVCSICYKQMALYYAPAFFFYLLGVSFSHGQPGWARWFVAGCARVGAIGVVVIATFAICFFPFITEWAQLSQVLHRMFPLARGLFEDKVANVWCMLDVPFNLRQNFAVTTLARLSLLATGVGFLPSCVHVLIRPTPRNFLLTLVNCSLAFFLFSFQVHEKSIMLPALPIALTAARYPAAAVAFMAASTVTVFPLLLKDDLGLQFVSVFGVALGLHLLCHRHRFSRVQMVLIASSVAVGCALCALHTFAPPPLPSLPDLWPLAIAAYGCAHFSLAFVYFNIVQLFGGGEKEGVDPGSKKMR